MSDWREELVEKMGKAFINALMFDDGIRAALAVAEPVIRERCAEIARNKVLTSEDCCEETGVKIAAAIREGGEDRYARG